MKVLHQTETGSQIVWDPYLAVRKRVSEETNTHELECRLVYKSPLFAYLIFRLEKDDDNSLKIPSYRGTREREYIGSVTGDECKIAVFYAENEYKRKDQFSVKDTETWASAGEIINDKKVFNLDVDASFSQILERHACLFALYAKNKGSLDELEVPSVGYFGNAAERIKMVIALGLQRGGAGASEGPFYYAGSYERALRYACLTSNKEPLTVDGRNVTYADTPVYKEGGIIRLYLLLGKSTIVVKLRNQENGKSETLITPKAAWVSEYDSVIQTRVLTGGKRIEPQYVVVTSAQIKVSGFQLVKTSEVTSKSDYKEKALPQ